MISHESFVFTTSTFHFGGTSRTKTSLSHLQLSVFEGCLARSFVFEQGTPRTKPSLSHLQLSVLGQPARKLGFHIFNFQFLRNVFHAFSHLQLSVFEGHLARKLLVHIFKLQFLIVLEGRLSRKLRFHIFNFQFLRGVSHDSFVSQLEPSGFEGPLARKLRFHNFNFQFLQEVSQDMRF